MPGIVNDALNRVLAKGVKLFAAGPTDATWRRLRGLKSVSALNLGRVGEVDATELWQGPTGIPEAMEEQYFVAQQMAGTKRVEPIELSLNSVPKNQIADEINVMTLTDWYSHDKVCTWSIRTRTGYEYAFNAQVDSINTTGEEGSLWNGTLKLLVNSWIIYRPIPQADGQPGGPWGNGDPIYGPPGVSNEVIAWSGVRPSNNADGTIPQDWNDPADTVGD